MAQRPNILVILVDDMGYSDIGCYGGEIHTPNLDALAAGGIRFTQYYNTARCCPARASLLTGLYPHQTGIGWMVCSDMGGGIDGYAGDLNQRCRTFAEVLRPAGYGTCISGKWHVTSEQFVCPEGPKHSWPLQRGFDRFFGILGGAANYFKPPIVTDNDWVGPDGMGSGRMLTEAIAENAALFIREHVSRTPQKPFVHYVAFTAPHWPLHARQETIDNYTGVYAAGWDTMRQAKYERMQDLGLIEPHWNLSVKTDAIPDWDSLSTAVKDEYAYRMAVYSAQVDEMDRGIGRILQALEKTGQLENTLILFMSDNGGCAEEIHRGSYEDWHDIGREHTFESYGEPWANYSNTPFREYKHWVHEGGIATPLIAHWPGGITEPGRICDQPAHLVDILPTCIELSGAEYAMSEHDAGDVHPLPGCSLTPAFRNEPITREQIFWEHEANRALRIGRWKLVAKGVNGDWELYDMARDRSETEDLAAVLPARVGEMADRWNAIARVTSVYPLFGDVAGMHYAERAGNASWRLNADQ